MDKRNYITWLTVRERLAAFCRELRSEGLRQLPGERELAVRLGCSRMTLRKALVPMLEEGHIIRTARCLELRDRLFVSHGSLRVGFITYGMHGEIIHYAFQQLYYLLREKLLFLGIDLKLILTGKETTEAELREQLESTDVVLLTFIAVDGSEPSPERCRELLQGRKVIALSDPWLEEFPCSIALDNVAAGRLAARVLLQAGCRRPGCIEIMTDVIFRKRLLGFREEMEEVGVPVFYGAKRAAGLCPELWKQELNRAAAAGCDGAFLLSDEFVEYIAGDLFRAGMIPGKFKLVTVNGSGEALRCVPPVTCVSHATEEVAERVAAYLRCLKDPEDAPILRAAVEPPLFLNATVGALSGFPPAGAKTCDQNKNTQPPNRRRMCV